ncbi:MAG: hypothetical protein IPP94_03660 [Ignavibacteria bacterium]|nr:hypothetical protein [Ignavibacteria bacterium]
MVDHIHFVEIVGGEDDLVQFGIVVDAVQVHPIPGGHVSGIDVEEFWMITHDAVICFRRVVVLDEMIPRMPFPDDVAAAGSCRLHLDDVVGPDGCGVIETGCDALR